MLMRYPEFLKAGGVIGYVAPSFGCNCEPYRSCFDSAREMFRGRGYGEKLGPNCYLGEGIGISNTPEACAKELMEGYEDPESDILISCGGGELMCETISRLDLERMAQAGPKWYLGYSDNTNMTFLLNTLWDTAAVYGPCAGAFGSKAPAFAMEPLHPALEDTIGILTGRLTEVSGYDKWEKESMKSPENPYAPYHLTEDRVLRLWVPQHAWKPEPGLPVEESGEYIQNANRFHGNLSMTGRLIGGCVDCLVNLLGTRFDRVGEFLERYREDGFIWFLEACDLNVFGIRRAMWQMEEAGWFQHVKGFLFGRPLCHGQEMMGLDAYEAVLATARKYHVPVVMDADLGHLPPAMPIVSGSIGTVEVVGNDIRIRYEYR